MTLRDILIGLGFQVDEQSQRQAEGAIKGIKSMAAKLLGAIGIGFSLVGMNQLAEEFNGVNDMIRNATRNLGEQASIQQTILKAANEMKSSYAETAKIVSNLVQESPDLFGSVEDAAEFAALTTKLFKSTGKSQEEINGLQEAINKSFAKGIVDSETINQLYEKAPEAISLIADSLGVAKEDLAKMVADGTIKLTDLKNAFISNADIINQKFDELDFSISDALLNIRNQWGYWLDQVNSTTGLTKNLGKLMVQAFSKMMEGLNKLFEGFQKLAQTVGGYANLLKTAAAAGAAIWIALNAKKILDFLKAAKAMMFGIGRMLNLATLKIALIAAAIFALFLIIDDIINFVKGNNSVLGEIFERAGIDADKARETINKAWQAVVSFLSKIWGGIKKTGEQIWGALGRFWQQNSQGIMDTLIEVWNAIWAVLSTVWVMLSDAAHSIFNALQAFWDKWGGKIKKLFAVLWKNCGDQIMAFLNTVKGLAEFISGVFSGKWGKAWEGIQTIFEGVFNGLLNIANNIWSAILIVFTGSAGDVEGRMEKMRGFLSGVWKGIKSAAIAVFQALKAFWERWGNQITSQFRIVWDTIGGILGGFVQTAQGILDFIAGVFTGDWEQAWQGVKEIFSGIWNAISSFFMGIWDTIHNWFGNKLLAVKDTLVNGFNSVIDFMQSLPGKALQWGRDFIDGLVQGIKDKIGAVTEAVSGVGEKIKSFLHFSVPDEGPLTDYESWMPDFMSGLAKGIQDNSPLVFKAVSGLAEGISQMKDSLNISLEHNAPMLGQLMEGLTPFGDISVQSGSKAALQGGGNRTTNVQQTNHITNKFEGGDRAAQTEGAKAMGKTAADMTAQMARALATGR